jgi:hypothetical protein
MTNTIAARLPVAAGCRPALSHALEMPILHTSTAQMSTRLISHPVIDNGEMSSLRTALLTQQTRSDSIR